MKSPDHDGFQTPGIASEFIHALTDLVTKCEQWPPPVWAYIRKSNTAKGNLSDMKAEAIDQLIAVGVHVVGVTAVVETSSIFADRPHLREAIDGARRKSAWVVAPMRCRLIRHRNFDGTHETEPPTIGEFQMLIEMANGVALATIIDPDSPPSVNRSFQTKRGKEAKGNPGGRPIERRDPFRARWLPVARELHANGLSLQAIADEVKRLGGRSRTAECIRQWLQRKD